MCGEPLETVEASINGAPYCHPELSEDITCYMRAQESFTGGVIIRRWLDV
jgi:hypothetical protein